MKIRVLACLMAVCCMLAGCGKTGNGTQKNPVELGASEKQTVSPPEDGWTVESLVDTMTFFGKELSYPITLEQLGEDFSIDTTDSSIKDNKIGVDLYYKNEIVCYIVYIGLSSVDDIKEDTPIGIMSVHSNEQFGNYFEINSVTFGTEWKDVIKLIGSSTDDKETVENRALQYRLNNLNNDDNNYLFVGFSDGKVSSFLFGR